MQVFKSKVDLWLLIVMDISIFVSLGAAFFVVNQGGTVNYAVGFFLAVVGAGLPVWLLMTTQYIVSDGALIIKSGPFKTVVPLDSIAAVSDTRNPLSSPALSLDRLQIVYQGRKRVMVSPIDKEQFRAAISRPVSNISE